MDHFSSHKAYEQIVMKFEKVRGGTIFRLFKQSSTSDFLVRVRRSKLLLNITYL